MALKIKDYEPIRVHHGQGFEIVLIKNEDTVPPLTYLECCISF